jgi:hypothetical protein
MANELRRILEAATALHTLLAAAGVPHAFCGGFMVALLANAAQCDVSHLSSILVSLF